MRYIGIALAFVAHNAIAQRPNDLPIHNAPVRTIAELPGVRIGSVFPSGSPNRLYYNVGDTLYVFDVVAKKSSRVAAGKMMNVDIARTNDRLVFARSIESGNVANVWTIPLDPKTGLATALPRRLALTPGDQPRISPDGKWVAFAAYDSADWSASQHVAVISTDGGAERVVARLTGGVGRIQWSPDGRTIYVMGFRPESFKWTGLPANLRALLRAPFAGGKIDTLPIEFTGLNGMSPDGRFFALTEEGSVANYVIADAQGKPVSRFSVPVPGQAGWVFQPAWGDAHSLIGVGSHPTSSVQVADLASGASREIVPAELQPEAPYWSPDGKSVATFGTSRGRRLLLVADAASGKYREYSSGVVQACCMYDRSIHLLWSPDGKAIAFHGAYREPLRIIDLATGTMREIGPKSTLIGDYRWRSDSRALQYTAAAPTGAYRTIHETGLDGSDRVLFDRIPNAHGAAGMRTDSTAIFSSDSGVYLVSIRTRAATRLRPYVSPWIESNRQGTVFATRDLISRQEISVVGANGAQTALKFPFFLPISPPFHQAGYAFLPDGKLLLIGRAPSGETAAYAVDPKGSDPRKVLELPSVFGWTYIDVSPDGKSLAYNGGPIKGGPIKSVIVQIDLTSFIPANK